MISLTPDMLKATYELLCTMPPFSKWNLPDADEVSFKVGRDRHIAAWHTYDGKHHVLTISNSCVSSIELLCKYMAHEMVHVHEANLRADRRDVQHSAAWHKWAQKVCKIHGWDPKAF